MDIWYGIDGVETYWLVIRILLHTAAEESIIDQEAAVNPDGRRLRAERCMPQRSVLQVMPGSLPDRELEIDVPEAFHMLNDAVEEWRSASDEQSMGISVPISAFR